VIAGNGDIVVARRQAHFLGRRFPCAIGRAGFCAHKREGDGTTPIGIFRILGALFRPDRFNGGILPGASPIGFRDIWSDDPSDTAYNQLLPGAHPYPKGHERLSRPDPLYDLILPIDYNWPDPVPGKGSAIFLHRWRSPHHPTEGCVAFAFTDLIWIAARVTSRTRLIVGTGAVR